LTSTVDVDLAAGDLLQAGHHPQGGGFAASRRPDQDHELLVLDLDVGPIHCHHVFVVDFAHALEDYFGHSLLLPGLTITITRGT
jgi:hypothetical protein